MKISKSKLVSMIKESIIRQLLNEARSYAYDTYTPYDPGFLTDEEYETLPEELRNIYEKEYRIEFVGNSWHYSGSGEWMYSLGEPEEWGVDDIQLSDDGGLSKDVEIAATINPEFAKRLKDNFEEWHMNLDDNSLEFQDEEPDYPEYDDDF